PESRGECARDPTTEAVARELIETKAYGISTKAHGIDAGAHALVCALARSPARFLVRSLGFVRTKPARVGANWSTGRRGFGGLCRRGSHGEARGGGGEGRLRRRLQAGSGPRQRRAPTRLLEKRRGRRRR